MRTKVGISALLVSACISDPAYIGEGPIQTEWDYGTFRDDSTAVSEEVDGVVEFRNKWIYDDEGRIIRYESDFLSGGEYASSVDGVPDEIWRFEPACADIAAAWPDGLYGMPHWLFPYPETRWKIP